MKLIGCFLFLIFSSSFCIAQNEELLRDEHGKLIYYELVEAKGCTKEQLKERVNLFLRKPYKELKLKTIRGDTVFVATGKLIINKTVLVMSHPSGEVLYHFQAEIKDEKFRFWLTNFNFVPYQRDRYGNFVTGGNKGMPLESSMDKLNVAQWKEYQVQTANYVSQFARVFKDYMVGKIGLDIPAQNKIVVKREW